MSKPIVRPFLVLAALWICWASISSNAGTLLVANKSDDTLSFIGIPSGKEGARVVVGVGPHEAAVSPDGQHAVVTNYGRKDKPGSTLSLVDLRRSKVISTIDLGEGTRPHGLAYIDDETIAVTAEGVSALLLVHLARGEVLARIETGQRISHMVAVTPDARRAFVANIGSGSVTAIDLKKRAVLAQISTGAGAEGIAVSPDGRHVWVSNREADTLSIIDVAKLEVIGSAKAPGFPIRVAFAPDGKTVYASSARTGEVASYDAKRFVEVRRVKISAEVDKARIENRLFGERFGLSPVPVGLQLTPDGSSLFVACTNADVVLELDPATLKVKRAISAGNEPDGMAYLGK